MVNHSERAHAKYSASGAERYFACPGSVPLSEGLPDQTNKKAAEGTRAHEVLEGIVKKSLQLKVNPQFPVEPSDARLPSEMVLHTLHVAAHILRLKYEMGAELLVEAKVSLDFIHPEAWGSLDYAILDHFGTLHILDFKYGRSLVSPKENLQFLFYALGAAFKYDWNFKKVRMWTLQPRAPRFEGYTFWEITMKELMAYIPKFQRAIRRVETHPEEYREGGHCFFCKAKAICPLKTQQKVEKAKAVFSPIRKK